MKSFFLILTCLLLLSSTALWAQPSVQKLNATVQLNKPTWLKDFRINSKMIDQASILSDKSNAPDFSGTLNWLKTGLEFRAGIDDLVEKSQPSRVAEFEVRKYQQMYKGLIVEHGIINITGKAGHTALAQLEFYPIPNTLRLSPSLSASEARSKAILEIGATLYDWQEAGSTTAMPQGELVIIKDFVRTNQMVLAYKFLIYALEPLQKAWVYVNAQDGTIILVDNIIKHANRNLAAASTQKIQSSTEKKDNNLTTPFQQGNLATVNSNGDAQTRFNGTVNIVTDLNAPGTPWPYRLWETRNGHQIITKNYRNKKESPANDAAATDLYDDDNHWDSVEYGGFQINAASKHNAALDIHFNMQVVDDYWMNIHKRRSFDDANGDITSYFHVLESPSGLMMMNAYWSGSAMYFGDGNNANVLPLVTIDICGHELGHAVCEKTAGLVYRWESGALNEGFSDIWGACINRYLKDSFPGIPGRKNDWEIGEEIWLPNSPNPGLRDMANPPLHNQPSTYNALPMWKPGTFEVCPNPNGNAGGNDQCGVHTNSGVLGKWFQLITMGGNGSNAYGANYNFVGINFKKSDSLAYLTELNLTPNASYKTARNVSVNAAITLWGDFAEAATVRSAWLAVGVDTATFNMSNTAAFTTNSFSSIAVGKNGAIWAGTTTNANNTSDGVYRYNGKIWEKAPFLTNNAVASIKADRNGGIWIAQYGRTGAQALTGGINYLADSTFGSNAYFGVTTNGLISRNSRSLYVDTFSLTPTNRSIWVSSLAQITAGNTGTGGVSVGFTPGASGNFSKLTSGIEDTSTTGGSQTIGGNKTEVWAFSSNNYLGRSQIVRFATSTADSIGIYDSTNVPVLPKTFTVKSIYFDALGNKWLGMQNTGLIVRDASGTWFKIDTATFRTILPYGTIVNNNAIAGDRLGHVYFGTTNGLVFYRGGPTNLVSSYRRYTTANGLPSNNIRGIAVDTIHYKLLLATDNGIVFFDQICVDNNDCFNQWPFALAEVTTVSSGNWSDPAVWSNNKVPDVYTLVSISHPIQVDIDANCNYLSLKTGGTINIQAGKTLEIMQPSGNVIQTDH